MAAEPDNLHDRAMKLWGRLWWAAGVVLAVLLGIAGLAIVALAVMFIVGMNQWGSNK